MELNFIEEAIPVIARTGGKGREPEKWEDHIAPLKDHEGKSFRVWTYEKRTGALSRVQSVRNRLNVATPKDNWTIAVRPVNLDGSEVFGVYLQYNGTYTPKEVAENARKRQERSDRIKAQRAAVEAAVPAVEAETTAA
jgi:hypothetical protein